MGKTRDLFKKIRDTKGTFHTKMGSTKDRNGLDLTDAEAIKKRWQEYTEELFKKHLHDPDNHDDVITNLEPDILECEVKWALESITMNKASGGDGIPVELFQILEARPFRCDLNQIPYDYTVEVTNRFNGFDLIERVPEELWMEVHDIVQGTGIKTIPRKRNAKKQNGCLRRPYK